MNLQTRTIDINDAMKLYFPRKVLVAYKEQGSESYYIETSDLIDGMIEGFRPASIEGVKQLFASVMSAEQGYIKCGKLFPRNVLHLSITGGDFRLMWWRPGKIQLVKFDKELKIKPVRIRVPAMIYDATRTRCKVYAIKTHAQCGAIYEAPYMNIMGDDAVCFGNTKIHIPAITSLDEITYEYEKAFWGSEFTDSGSTDYMKLWKNLSKGQHKHFPLMSLKNHKKHTTIRQLLSNL